MTTRLTIGQRLLLTGASVLLAAGVSRFLRTPDPPTSTRRLRQTMADSNRELVFCHSCEDEWYRDEHGLICPQCSSDVVEIVSSLCNANTRLLRVLTGSEQIDRDSDPRVEHDMQEEMTPDNPFHPLHSLHHHNPWAHGSHEGDDAPDPEEADISRMQWTAPTGMHFSRTVYTSDGHNITREESGGPGAPADMGFDAFAPMLQSILGPGGILNPATQQRQQQQQQQQQRRLSNQQQGQDQEQGQRSSGPEGHPSEQRSPLQEGPAMFGPGPHLHGGITIHTHGTGQQGHTTRHMALDDLSGIFSTYLGGPVGAAAGPPGGMPGQANSPLSGLLQHLFNPANARMGDAVYSNEALDRVVSQLMEQHSTSTAPGPASEAAINSLPKMIITKEHQDSAGNADCSICMEAAAPGSEVTVLPCKHWFHGECVTEWLHQHDTCPQCRRGIMAKQGDEVRQTGEQPRNWQIPPELQHTQSADGAGTAGSNTGMQDTQGSGTASSPIQFNESPPPDAGGSPSSVNRSGILGRIGRTLRPSSQGEGGSGGNNNST
jgi:E3 ubiquitin-protein ligase RNF115/126